MTKPKLKTCPFCGGGAWIQYTPGSWGYYSAKYQVKCTKCGASSGEFEDPEQKRVNPENRAAALWNARVENKEEP